MEDTERTLLLDKSNESTSVRKHRNRTFTSGLSSLFAIICIVDVFGVFPIVALPKSIIDCGLNGIIIVFIVSSLQMYTASLLGRCWLIAEQIEPNVESKNRYPYSALAELTFGTRFSKIVTFFLDITVFTGGIPNLLVAAQTLQLLGRRVSENHLDLSFCYWIIIIGTLLCPLLWLGSPKDMKLLCTLSVTMVFGTFILVLSSMLFDNREINNQDLPEPETSLPVWINMITAYGIITFQFDIHPSLLTIHVDMNDKTKISRVVIAGFAVSLGMFAMTTSVAYWRYGTTAKPSLLGSLPTSIALHFAALLVALQLCLTLAVSNSALYQHLEDCLGISREFNHKRCILRTTLSALAILIAESVPKFNIVMSLIGGTFIGPLVFVLPPIFHMKIGRLKQKHDEELQLAVFNNIVYNAALPETISKSLETETLELEASTHTMTQGQAALQSACSGNYAILENLFALVVVCFGVSFTIGATYLNITNVIEYTSFSQPCLYNLTLLSPF